MRAHPSLFRGSTHGIIDWCEDVSSKDISDAIKEGYDSIELVKRYTTVTMGPTQGKLETINTMAVVAETLGKPIEEVGTTVWRPPYAPISLGALAGRHLEPVHVSAMQPWHEAHGARPLIAGQWIRPEHYGDPAAEVINTRANVGIIDVTPLGKYLLHGPDTAKFLDLLYVNSWSSLAVGAAQYGLMCADDGVVLDDGITARITDDEYYMTTTSSGAVGIGEWMQSWLQCGHGHACYRSTGYSWLCGYECGRSQFAPFAASLVQGIDLDSGSFPYMAARKGCIAGIDNCYIMRLGFTGELSYELHVPLVTDYIFGN